MAKVTAENVQKGADDYNRLSGQGLPGNPSDPTGNPPYSPFNLGLPGHRPYMAGLGRFFTRARLEEILGGEHPYAYAMNNPVTYTDPSGLKPLNGQLFGPPFNAGPRPGTLPGTCLTCREINDFVWEYCTSCYRGGFMVNPSCQKTCSDISLWYYMTCKTPAFPGFYYPWTHPYPDSVWCPRYIQDKCHIVPIYSPPIVVDKPDPNEQWLATCLDKCKDYPIPLNIQCQSGCLTLYALKQASDTATSW